MIDIPGMDQLLDETYMAYYDIVRDQLEYLLSNTMRERHLDHQRLRRVVIVVIDKLAADGAKAFSQIHNMEHQGDYVFYHGLNVGIMAALMGNWLGWDEKRRRELAAINAKLRYDHNLTETERYDLQRSRQSLLNEQYEANREHSIEARRKLCC